MSKRYGSWFPSPNISSKAMSDINYIPWRAVFPFLLWLIWLNRNSIVFNKPVDNNQKWLINVHRAVVGPDVISKQTSQVEVGRCPSSNFMKLNFDGSALGNPGRAGSSGLFRNAKGRWIGGYSRKVGHASCMLAELWGLRDGLQIAVKKGFKNLSIECDSKVL